MGMRARRRIAAVVGCSALSFGVLVASADVAEAGVRQRSRVIERSSGYSNSGGNIEIGDRSTSTGGTSTSSGKATVSSGTAKATGSWSFSFVSQTVRRR